jgi:pimeloyl-ACP methyl ester carboxylesterase
MKLISIFALVFFLTLTGTTLARPTAAKAQTRFVEVNGVRMAYRSIGSGSPIVLANRMRGTLDTWDPLFLDSLAEHHRVVTFDYPGVGYSSGTLPDDIGEVADFINDFTQALKLKRFAVLGWSWGGLTAQATLLSHPDRVTHAILVGTNPPGPREYPMQQVFIERAVKPVNDLADEEVLFFEPRSEVSRAVAKSSHERIYARAGVTARIPSATEQFQVYFKAAATFHADEAGRRMALMQTRKPILILGGDNDPGAPTQNWLPLVGQMRNAQFLIYSEAGHGPQHQLPQLTAQYMAAFLAHDYP